MMFMFMLLITTDTEKDCLDAVHPFSFQRKCDRKTLLLLCVFFVRSHETRFVGCPCQPQVIKKYDREIIIVEFVLLFIFSEKYFWAEFFNCFRMFKFCM